MPSVFFSYSHLDEALRDQLETQLALLRRQGIIDVWHDRRIGAGEDFAKAIDKHVETDDIILLLVSADFLASDYCYDTEMLRAMARHEAGEAIVIPVILRACDWQHAPFGKLNATPKNGRPVTQFPDRDQAFLEVALAVRAAAERIEGSARKPEKSPSRFSTGAPALRAGPRSSDLRLAKTFSERDKDNFKIETFEFMAKFFENSLSELEQRNAGIETGFRKIDANRFSSKIYKSGRVASACTVFMGGGFIDGIAYSSNETTESNAFNEMLTVHSDEQSLYLTAMGMAVGRRQTEAKLTAEGASEFYWSMLIGPLQRS